MIDFDAGLSGDYKIFAVDTGLLYYAKDKMTLDYIINDGLKRLFNWISGNILTINTDKTKYLIFKYRNKADINTKIIINDKVIERIVVNINT